MSWRRRGALPKHGYGQLGGGGQTQGVAVVADLAMGAPGASGNPPLMMGREVALLADKAKGGLRGQPGKPLRGVGRKREQATLGAEHDVVALLHILDTRDDLRRRDGPWRRRGRGPTRLGPSLGLRGG